MNSKDNETDEMILAKVSGEQIGFISANHCDLLFNRDTIIEAMNQARQSERHRLLEQNKELPNVSELSKSISVDLGIEYKSGFLAGLVEMRSIASEIIAKQKGEMERLQKEDGNFIVLFMDSDSAATVFYTKEFSFH